ncbi:MAG: ATP-binding protein [Anaerolineales bacterium]|nr:ATP-binding protein [Anaerolineales bacterium]
MRLSIRARLMIGMSVVLGAMAIVGRQGVVGMNDINQVLHSVNTDQVIPARMIANTNIALLAWNRATLNHVLAENIQEMDEFEQIMSTEKAAMTERLEILSEIENLSPRGQEMVIHLQGDLVQAEPIRDQVVALSRSGDQEAARLLMRTELRPIIDHVNIEMTEFLLLQESQLAQAEETTDARLREGLVRIVWIMVVGIAISLLLSLLIARSITGPLNKLVKGAVIIGQGNLKHRVDIKTRDEIGELTVAFNQMTEKRQRADEALRESEQWLSTTLRSIGDAVIATDAEGHVTLMNPIAEELTGWDEDEAAGKPMEDVFNIINEQTGEPAENPVAKVLREGVVVGLANHTVLIAKDGTKRPIADSGAPMRDEAGNIIGTVMVFRDITERRRAEEKIASLAKFPSENINPVLRVAKNGTILYANEASHPLLNVWGCQVNQPLPDDWRKFILDVLSSGLSKDAEVEYEDRIFSLAFAPVVDKDYVNVYGLDITERKEMQERLVRTEKLAVLGQLAGGVGHELRNPLGAIKNAAYFLNMALEEPEQEIKETLEILEKEVATSERIISSLLDFARQKPPSRRKVNVNEVLQEALSHVEVPENVAVERQLDETLPVILTDPDQLVQVFGNIILNGIQAMPDGGQLVVKTEIPDPEWVTISVTDTGMGIPEENLDKLFEPLFTTKARGIGLGLAITRTLVEGHGGTLEVQSEVGEGSTFTVRLPMGRGLVLSDTEGSIPSKDEGSDSEVGGAA